MRVPFCAICCFSLFIFVFTSGSLVTLCLSVVLLGFVLPGTLCTSWAWLTVSFPTLGKFPAIISSHIFSGPFFLSSPSGTHIMWILVHLMFSQRSRRLSSFYPPPFFFQYSVSQQCFPPFCLTGHSSVLLPQLFCYWFLLMCCSSLFFSSSRSLVNISCIFSILFLRSWVVFTIVIWISFSGRLSISIHLVLFVEVCLVLSSWS